MFVEEIQLPVQKCEIILIDGLDEQHLRIWIRSYIKPRMKVRRHFSAKIIIFLERRPGNRICVSAEKVSKVYEASTVKTEMKVGEEWKTLANKTNERVLAHEFTWEGKRLESVMDHNLEFFYSFGYDENGRVDDAQYTFEYSSVVNPLRGFVFCQHPGYGIVFDYNGIDGLSKNLPSRIAYNKKNRYEYTYSGEPVATVEKHLIADTDPTLHFYTDYTLDFEYVQ